MSVDQVNDILKQPGNVIKIFETIMEPCISICQVYVAYIFLFRQDRVVSLMLVFRLLSKPISKLKVLLKNYN